MSGRRPRPPRKLLRRYLAQAGLVLLAVAAVLFYQHFNADDTWLPPAKEAAPETPAAPQTPGRPGEAPPLPEGPEEPAASAPEASVPEAPVPFAGRSLEAVAAELSRRYAGRAPKAFGERLPGVVGALPEETTRGPEPLVIALTLDACGGKAGASYDAGLIDFLRERRIPASLFVTSLWARANPERLRELAADPLFSIEAHGARHKPCTVDGRSVYGIKGTASVAELTVEVEGNARDIEAATGRRPRWFRSGTAFYDDVALEVIADLGLGVAGYSLAGDEGATLAAPKVAAKVMAARHGDILLLHMNHPESGTREGLKRALAALLERGAVFVRLGDVPGQ